MLGNWSKVIKEDGRDYSTELIPPTDAYYTDANGVGWSRSVLSNEQRGNWKPSSGQPMHWPLAVAPENVRVGDIYQHTFNFNVFVSSYVDSRRLCELDASGEDCVAHDQDIVSRGSAVHCASWHDYDDNAARLYG
ncbi:hypothetical protein F4825DRAFT_458705 [Nemania diffusa]|nr:hypothetical protein F4825DRAFT_458705 [Nemania diffusa]